MERRRFGNAEASAVGQGTWYLEQGDRAAAVAALRRGLDLGMTHIDTAEMYGSGAAETLVGEAIAGRRDEVFLVSKVLPSQRLAAAARSTACERSLAAPRHRPARLLPAALARPAPARATPSRRSSSCSGPARSAPGASATSTCPTSRRLGVAGHGRLACNQVLYHLGERAIEHAVIPWCERHGVAVVAYSPFGHAGGFPGPRTPGGRVLEEIAAAHGATPRQVALALPAAPARGAGHPQGRPYRPCRGQCRRRRPAARRDRPRPARRGLPAGSQATPSADALASDFR